MTTGVSTPRAGVNGDSLASAMADDEAARAQSVVIGGGVDHGAVVAGHHNTVTVNNYTVHERCTVEGAAPTSIGPNPYRGLLAFRTVDRANFFGRGLDVERLVAAFHRAQKDRPGAGPLRFVAILGPSGSGKSSLALAGLVPRLAETPPPGFEGARVEVFTPGSAPLALLTRLRAAAKASPPLILVVDQLEEGFTLCRDAGERRAFFDGLLALAQEADGRAAVIVTLRTDFLGETRAHPALDRAIAEAGVLIPAMSEEQLREAIALPAKRAGHPFDAALVQLLIEQAGDREGALPLLSHALACIWNGLAAGVPAGETLAAIGGVGGALAGTAEAIFTALTLAEQGIARRVFLRLVKIDAGGKRDARRRVARDDLVVGGFAPDAIHAVIQAFVDARLLTLASDDEQRVIVDVSHEALFRSWKRLREWIAEGRAELLLRQRLDEAIAHWKETQRAAGQLWRSPDLELLEALQKRGGDLGPDEVEFLARSAAQRARERDAAQISRRNRRLLVGAVVAAGLAAAGAAAISVLWRRADASTRALYREQGRQEVLAGNGLRSLAYLEEVYRHDPDDAALRYLVARSAAAVEARVQVFDPRGAAFAALAPDGKTAVIARSDGSARLWDVVSGRVVRDLHEGQPAFTARFSADGRLVVTAASDGARTWDVDRGVVVRHFVAPQPDRAFTVSAELSRDGRRLVTASGQGSARLWDARSGELLRVFDSGGHGGVVVFAAFSPDGRLVATAGTEGILVLWDTLTGEVVTTLRGHTATVRSVEFSPDGTRLVSASADRSAIVWDVSAGTPIVTLGEHDGEVVFASWSPDGARVVTTSGTAARVWDAYKRRLLATFGDGTALRTASFSADGTRVITAGMNGPSVLWNAFDGRLLVVQASPNSVITAAWSRDGASFATGLSEGVRFWSAAEGDAIGSFPGLARFVRAVDWSADGRRFVTGGVDGARLWDAVKRVPVGPGAGGADAVSFASLRPDGERMLTVAPFTSSESVLVRVVDAGTGRLIRTLTGHNGPVMSALYSPDGRRIVTAGSDGIARIWDAEGEGSISIGTLGYPRSFASWRPDGQRVVVANEDGSVEVADARSGEVLVTLRGHSNAVSHARYSADGRRLVTAGRDQTARVWDADSGALLATLGSHWAEVSDAAFDPTGDRILTVGFDGTAIVWDAHLEARSPAQITELARCRAPFQLEEGHLARAEITPGACAAVERAAPPFPEVFRAQQLRSLGTWAVGPDAAAFARPGVEEALRIFTAARSRSEIDATRFLLGKIERAQGQLTEARRDLEEARRGYAARGSYAEEATVLRALADEAAARADFVTARKEYAESGQLGVEHHDVDVQVRAKLGLVTIELLRGGDLDARAAAKAAADAELDAAAALIPASNGSLLGVHLLRSSVWGELGFDDAQALASLDAAAVLSPHDHLVLGNRVGILIGLGRHDEAIAAAAIALPAQTRPEARALIAALAWVAATLANQPRDAAKWAGIAREAYGLLPRGPIADVTFAGVRRAIAVKLKVAPALRPRLVALIDLLAAPVDDATARALADLLAAPPR
jgi:WD40 repeat protein/tetratricopeptide (TPR) repeat protein/energy-coupling factor transporter ATP-binding protein EcfA2